MTLRTLGAECGPEEEGGKPNDQDGGYDRTAFHGERLSSRMVEVVVPTIASRPLRGEVANPVLAAARMEDFLPPGNTDWADSAHWADRSAAMSGSRQHSVVVPKDYLSVMRDERRSRSRTIRSIRKIRPIRVRQSEEALHATERQN
ncbi:MAG TPA: hypothetical protein VJR24_08930 [Gemmatimonadaceae bacterium]|nr:hypothetical protein [Gemmatimonadaceae bacterium]